MTIPEIIESVSAVAGNYCESSFHRDRKRLNIEPLGIRQRPQQYPLTAVPLILAARGYAPDVAPLLPPADTAARRLGLVTLPELRNEKRKAKRKARR